MEKNTPKKLHQRLLSFTIKEVLGTNKCFQFLNTFGLPGGLQTFIILIIRLFLFGYFNIHFIFRIQNSNTRDETGRFSLMQIHGPSANLR